MHAGTIFETKSGRVAFDLIFENPFSVNCYAFPKIEFDLKQIREDRFSAVFISHNHDDHLSLKSLDLLDRQTPVYLFSVFEEPFEWLKELGFESVHSLVLGEPVQIGELTVTPRRALDADVDCIFQISALGFNVLNVVDAWIDPLTLEQLKKLNPWDLILWPFQTMRELEVISPRTAAPSDGLIPPEHLQQLMDLRPKVVVPSSCQFQMEDWSWYNQAFFPISYQSFEQQVKDVLPKSTVVKMGPGSSVVLMADSITKGEPVPWIHPVGDQDLDYQYDRQVVPQNPQMVADHFPPLLPDQMDAVIQYCEASLPTKYRTLDVLEEGFFAVPRSWRLTVYDAGQQPRNFHYAIDGFDIEPSLQVPVDWSTEVSAHKLWAALYRGETLTSMYLRLNDHSVRLEDVRGIDPGEDPLIRCLFSGNFGAYQKNQLVELKAQKAGSR